MQQLLYQLINQSLDDLYLNDEYLISHKASERDLTFHFTTYFKDHMRTTSIAQYNVDCEYNRDGNDSKQIDGDKVYPDFIVHRRGSNEDNLLIIEFKTWWNPNNTNDIEKLKNMMSEQYRYKYKYAYSIVLAPTRKDVKIIQVRLP